MPRKTSIYLDETIEGILAVREGAPPKTRRHGRRSQIIATLLRRYDELCHEDLPALSPEEWSNLISAGRTWSAPSEGATSSVLVTTLIEATKRLPAGEQNNGLVTKILSFTPGQRLAIVDFVERYWAAKDRGGPSPAIPGTKPARRRSQQAESAS